MSRQSRKRNTRQSRRTKRTPKPSQLSEEQAIFEALFAHLLEEADGFLGLTSPLDAEQMASGLAGAWHDLPLMGLTDADPERVVGEGLVAYAGKRRTPAARALLAALGAVAEPRVARRARARAAALGAVAGPTWLDSVGTATADGAWVSGDVYGDQDAVFVRYSYAGEWPHVLCVLVDRNLGGIAKDAFVGAPEILREWEGLRPDTLLRGRLREIDLAEASARMLHAFEMTHTTFQPPVSEDLPHTRALALARTRALPRPATLPEPAEFDEDGRVALVREFGTSEHAAAVPPSDAVHSALTYIVDYGGDYAPGRPLHWSPGKAGLFLLDWLSRKVMLDDDEIEVMPDVLRAWARFAGERTGLPAEAVRETLSAIDEDAAGFAAAARDPKAGGPAKQVFSAMLADGVDLGDEDAVQGWIDDRNVALAHA